MSGNAALSQARRVGWRNSYGDLRDDARPVLPGGDRSCWYLQHSGKTVVEGERAGRGPGVLVAVSGGRDGLGFAQGDGREQLAQRSGAVQPDGMYCWPNGNRYSWG